MPASTWNGRCTTRLSLRTIQVNKNKIKMCTILSILMIMLCSRLTSGFQSHATSNGPLQRSAAAKSLLFASGNGADTPSKEGDASTSTKSNFGESVPYIPIPSTKQNDDGESSTSTSLFSAATTTSDNIASSSVAVAAVVSTPNDEVEMIAQNRIRNMAVAIASFAVAIVNYGWQFTHPVTAVEIMASMERESASIATIGNNGKPTVIDFWAPWCENCKVSAPTLQAVEHEYGDKVNFISINADVGKNWPLIQFFGVDAIPHLALLSGEGDVETALIGPMSRKVLKSDIDALLNKREDCEATPPTATVEVVKVCHDDLPYTMFDAFSNRPDGRRVNFVEMLKKESQS